PGRPRSRLATRCTSSCALWTAPVRHTSEQSATSSTRAGCPSWATTATPHSRRSARHTTRTTDPPAPIRTVPSARRCGRWISKEHAMSTPSLTPIPTPTQYLICFLDLPQEIQDAIEELSKPWPVEQIQIRPGTVNRDGTGALALAYQEWVR